MKKEERVNECIGEYKPFYTFNEVVDICEKLISQPTPDLMPEVEKEAENYSLKYKYYKGELQSVKAIEMSFIQGAKFYKEINK